MKMCVCLFATLPNLLTALNSIQAVMRMMIGHLALKGEIGDLPRLLLDFHRMVSDGDQTRLDYFSVQLQEIPKESLELQDDRTLKEVNEMISGNDWWTELKSASFPALTVSHPLDVYLLYYIQTRSTTTTLKSEAGLTRDLVTLCELWRMCRRRTRQPNESYRRIWVP